MNTARTLLAALSLVAASMASAQVYTQTNEPGQNRIAEIGWNPDGTLTKPHYYLTGGQGTGTGLGIQGAVALSEDHRWLFVVNAGSNDLSTFKLGAQGAQLVNRISTRGNKPVSVTSHGSLVYVVNAGDGKIVGFRANENGQLSPIAGGSRLTKVGAAPGQISFNPEGDTLYVSEKNTNRLDIFTVDASGAIAGREWISSPGATPFGFAFGRRGKLFVSEAQGGAAGASTLSSYITGDDGYATPISAAVPTFQTAACWVGVSWDGKFAYTGNAGSGTITGYRVFDGGQVSILTSTGVSGRMPNGANALDLATDASHLYALGSSKGLIASFAIAEDGRLVRSGVVTGLPTTATGIAVR